MCEYVIREHFLYFWETFDLNMILIIKCSRLFLMHLLVWICIVCLVRSLSALCSVVCVRVSSSSAAAVASCCNSSESLQSDWGRFLYDHKSLCVDINTGSRWYIQTVINCCIFSLNSTDAHWEGRLASTSTEPSWCSWFTCAHIFY